MTRAELLEQVFGQRGDLQTRAVDMAIAVLRKKLEPDPGEADADRLGQRRGLRVEARAVKPAARRAACALRRGLLASLRRGAARWRGSCRAGPTCARASRASATRRRRAPPTRARRARARAARRARGAARARGRAAVLPLPEPDARSARVGRGVERLAVAARARDRRTRWCSATSRSTRRAGRRRRRSTTTCPSCRSRGSSPSNRGFARGQDEPRAAGASTCAGSCSSPRPRPSSSRWRRSNAAAHPGGAEGQTQAQTEAVQQQAQVDRRSTTNSYVAERNSNAIYQQYATRRARRDACRATRRSMRRPRDGRDRTAAAAAATAAAQAAGAATRRSRAAAASRSR